jgi:hypothetical protein
VEQLHLQFYPRIRVGAATVSTICALTKLRVLAMSGDAYVERRLRRCRYLCKSDPRGVLTDADTARLLASLPVLESLDLSVYNGRNMGVTFATPDYDEVSAPRLRTLRAAGAGRLRGEGLALARICPNLRQLDVRAAFAMSREEFADGLLELCESAPPDALAGGRNDGDAAQAAAAVTGWTRGQRQTHRLRLPKLRRLYSSFRRRLPKALNFNMYRGGWTDVRRGESGAPCWSRATSRRSRCWSLSS